MLLQVYLWAPRHNGESCQQGNTNAAEEAYSTHPFRQHLWWYKTGYTLLPKRTLVTICFRGQEEKVPLVWYSFFHSQMGMESYLGLPTQGSYPKQFHFTGGKSWNKKLKVKQYALLRKETHFIWGVLLASWRDTSSFPAPKACFLARSVLLRTWALKTAWGFWKWTTVCSSTAVVHRLGYLPSSANKQAFKQTPLGTDIPLLSNQQQIFCTFSTICTKSEKVKRVGGKPNLFWKHLPSKIIFPLFQSHAWSHPGQACNWHSSRRVHQCAGARRGKKLWQWQLCKVHAG